MANQWFRLYGEFAHDAKVQMLSECNQRRLIMLFCIRCNGDVTLHDDEVTFQLRVTDYEWAETKAIFISKGFINKDNELLNWDKRQFISDSSAERVAKHRAKIKADVTPSNVTVTLPEQNRTEQIQNRIEKYIPPIPEELFTEFAKVRKDKRAAKFTQRMFFGISNQAALAGITAERAIEICCERGWTSFQATWIKDKSNKPMKGYGIISDDKFNDWLEPKQELIAND